MKKFAFKIYSIGSLIVTGSLFGMLTSCNRQAACASYSNSGSSLSGSASTNVSSNVQQTQTANYQIAVNQPSSVGQDYKSAKNKSAYDKMAMRTV
ncbi:MAG: hypothetical protein LW688_04350, partial [Cryomorphaceae bacterium]|nr:hypothetical protein [Cryomorphaceae bacterium]